MAHTCRIMGHSMSWMRTNTESEGVQQGQVSMFICMNTTQTPSLRGAADVWVCLYVWIKHPTGGQLCSRPATMGVTMGMQSECLGSIVHIIWLPSMRMTQSSIYAMFYCSGIVVDLWNALYTHIGKYLPATCLLLVHSSGSSVNSMVDRPCQQMKKPSRETIKNHVQTIFSPYYTELHQCGVTDSVYPTRAHRTMF